ncbi:unnamed protein product [Closterium sp. Yama58-4]|nr:unnamed protein product [Closterium sp. Yama58-4]
MCGEGGKLARTDAEVARETVARLAREKAEAERRREEAERRRAAEEIGRLRAALAEAEQLGAVARTGGTMAGGSGSVERRRGGRSARAGDGRGRGVARGGRCTGGRGGGCRRRGGQWWWEGRWRGGDRRGRERGMWAVAGAGDSRRAVGRGRWRGWCECSAAEGAWGRARARPLDVVMRLRRVMQGWGMGKHMGAGKKRSCAQGRLREGQRPRRKGGVGAGEERAAACVVEREERKERGGVGGRCVGKGRSGGARWEEQGEQGGQECAVEPWQYWQGVDKWGGKARAWREKCCQDVANGEERVGEAEGNAVSAGQGSDGGGGDNGGRHGAGRGVVETVGKEHVAREDACWDSGGEGVCALLDGEREETEDVDTREEQRWERARGVETE